MVKIIINDPEELLQTRGIHFKVLAKCPENPDLRKLEDSVNVFKIHENEDFVFDIPVKADEL